MESFTFNGQAASDFGLLVSDKDIYFAPARDVSFVSVPGRNGDVLIDNNRYENINVSYTVSFRQLKERAAANSAVLIVRQKSVLRHFHIVNFDRTSYSVNSGCHLIHRQTDGGFGDYVANTVTDENLNSYLWIVCFPVRTV